MDGDGKFEVIMGTSLGLLYVMDGESGFVRRFFPLQFHSIQAQVAVADVQVKFVFLLIVISLSSFP
jgi:hypothetical protein